MDPYKIIVGIDFGTTGTGVSCCFVDHNNNITQSFDIVRWPGMDRECSESPKVPSTIAYAGENARTRRDRWGYEVLPHMTAYSWTKLLLDDIDTADFIDTGLEETIAMGLLKLPHEKDATQVVADFLAHVYQHIYNELERRVRKDVRDTPLVEFWLAFPATWGHGAQTRMRTAAESAGFGTKEHETLFMITESEAAAFWVMQGPSYGSENPPNPGDRIIICDCGGGTVDIATYQVSGEFPNVFVDETSTSIGGKCGATAIDRNFYALTSARCGRAFDQLPYDEKALGSTLMQRFEKIKREFGGSTENGSEISLPPTVDSIDGDTGRNGVILSDVDLRGLFDPVIYRIAELMQRQIQASFAEPSCSSKTLKIIFVGGLSASEYFRQCILQLIAAPFALHVTFARNPQIAVARGAIAWALYGQHLRTRKSKRYYGITSEIPFRSGIDNEEDSFVDGFTGTLMTRSGIAWFIRKDERYASHQTVSYQVVETHRQGDGLLKPRRIWACNLDVAPTSTRHSNDIELVGVLFCDFTNIHLDQFPHYGAPGQVLYNLRYTIRTTFSSRDGSLIFEAVVGDRDQTIGVTSVGRPW